MRRAGGARFVHHQRSQGRHPHPPYKKKRPAGPFEENRSSAYAVSTLRGAMKYSHTSAMKYIVGIMVNSTP